ncbi:hypothetical protein BDV39DRAFT_59229 [Aspergillus sergii]|uniref:Hydrophobin n=1 Tax=Aspergillus sergii TaxID=1034303 RepID=A0A5N6X7M7_9EURO|nr:hypothetical protein BDV39DRAFT_59229 [Aspergillus sergii]
MNPKAILLLLTTITLSTAIPFSQQQTPASTPTGQSANPALSSIAASASVSPKANNGTCPDTHRSKQCCQSIDSIAEGITKPLGQLVPLLDGATVKSILSLDCMYFFFSFLYVTSLQSSFIYCRAAADMMQR